MIPVQSNSSLLNLPDLMIILFLLFSIASGARRGLTGAVIGLCGKIAVVLGANWFAKLCAPALTQTVVKQLTTAIFESKTIQELKLEGVLSEDMVAQAAASMAQGIVYVLLVIVFLIVLSLVLSLITRSLNILTRFPPLGALNRLTGAAIGLVGGILVIVLALWLAHVLRPEIFTQIGWLSPNRIQQTVLLRSLLTYFPVL